MARHRHLIFTRILFIALLQACPSITSAVDQMRGEFQRTLCNGELGWREAALPSLLYGTQQPRRLAIIWFIAATAHTKNGTINWFPICYVHTWDLLILHHIITAALYKKERNEILFWVISGQVYIFVIKGLSGEKSKGHFSNHGWTRIVPLLVFLITVYFSNAWKNTVISDDLTVTLVQLMQF